MCSSDLLNRIDDIVVFKQLDKEQITKIIDIQLEKLRVMLADRGIEIVVEESARDLISTEGYDPVYGARPLKRAIQTLVQNPLAVKLLSGEIGNGQKIYVSAEDGSMKFTTEEASNASSGK